MKDDYDKSTKVSHALIYCRVSSTKQRIEGSGLESQEQRCRAYADEKGYEVEAVFPDDVSGGGDFMRRPGMVALLSYLDAQKGKPYVVIFDDLKRFARDTEFHLKLRREFLKRGANIECLNFRFEDTPEGKFIETVIAAQGELEREQNRRQVVQKMKAVKAVIGGEGNGGVILPDLHYGRDALVGIALFLSHLANSGKQISTLRQTYPDYQMAKNKLELSADLDLNKIFEALRTKYRNEQINTEDGLKIDFESGWVHLRPSNTEPIVRVYAESKSAVIAENLARKIMQDVQGFR